VEFAFRIPTELKMPQLKAKYLLRTIARHRLPAALSQLPKHGFTAPIGPWIAGPYKNRFRADVLASSSTVSGLVDIAIVRRMFDEHEHGRADHSYPLWAVWVLERWSQLKRASVNALAAEA
jgi:asparagine synthase (glutamine-hydrolysing)